MNRRRLALGFVALVAACRSSEPPPLSPAECLAELGRRGVAYDRDLGTTLPIVEDGVACDVDTPVLLAPSLRGVAFRYLGAPRPMIAACQLALRIDDMAALAAADGITEIDHLGTFNCRRIRGKPAISMHSYALAIDVAGVKDRAGAPVSVVDDWYRDGSDGARWLHDFAETLYDRRVFNIVLTPDYNADHRNHLHLDLKPGERFFSRRNPWLRWLVGGVLLLAFGGVGWQLTRPRRRRRRRRRS